MNIIGEMAVDSPEKYKRKFDLDHAIGQVKRRDDELAAVREELRAEQLKYAEAQDALKGDNEAEEDELIKHQNEVSRLARRLFWEGKVEEYALKEVEAGNLRLELD